MQVQSFRALHEFSHGLDNFKSNWHLYKNDLSTRWNEDKTDFLTPRFSFYSIWCNLSDIDVVFSALYFNGHLIVYLECSNTYFFNRRALLSTKRLAT